MLFPLEQWFYFHVSFPAFEFFARATQYKTNNTQQFNWIFGHRHSQTKHTNNCTLMFNRRKIEKYHLRCLWFFLRFGLIFLLSVTAKQFRQSNQFKQQYSPCTLANYNNRWKTLQHVFSICITYAPAFSWGAGVSSALFFDPRRLEI